MTTLIILLVVLTGLLLALAGVFRAFNKPKVEKYENEGDRIEIEEENVEHKNEMEEREQKHRLKMERRAAWDKRNKERRERWRKFWRGE